MLRVFAQSVKQHSAELDQRPSSLDVWDWDQTSYHIPSCIFLSSVVYLIRDCIGKYLARQMAACLISFLCLPWCCSWAPGSALWGPPLSIRQRRVDWVGSDNGFRQQQTCPSYYWPSGQHFTVQAVCIGSGESFQLIMWPRNVVMTGSIVVCD